MELVQNIERLSISQIKAFQRNPFYWALSYIAKLPQPESPALKFGKELHAEIERLFMPTRLLPQTDSYTQSRAFALFNKLHNDFQISIYHLEIEKEFIAKISDDLPPFKGIIDILIREYTLDDNVTIPAILDHKTVKNGKFALDEEDLKSDLQLSLYAYFTKSIGNVYVQHNQIFKESDEIRFVRATLTQKDIINNLEIIDKTAREMLEYHKKVIKYGLFSQEADCQERCVKKCKYMFGKCPYSDICEGKISIEQYLTRLKGDTMAEEKPKWLLDPMPAADLSIMMQQAREYYEKKPHANKFELRESIAQGIIDGMRKHDIKAFVLTQFLLHGNDPDYMPVITRLKEYGAKIFIEIK
jgi:RecB family exonuclease